MIAFKRLILHRFYELEHCYRSVLFNAVGAVCVGVDYNRLFVAFAFEHTVKRFGVCVAVGFGNELERCRSMTLRRLDNLFAV